MEQVTQCPICDQRSFQHYLSCKDYTVSLETFNLMKCINCGFVITSPRPDPNDLGNYYLSDKYISHSAKSKTLFDKLYKVSRHFSLNWKVDLVKNYSTPHSESLSLLDYGCGTGHFLQACNNAGVKTKGVEPSDAARHHANLLTHGNVESHLDNITSSFDVITLWHVLEHIPDLNDILQHLKRTLNKNGTMFIAVPNHHSHDAQKYKEHWAGYDVPRHLWHFTEETMKQLLDKNGLSVKKIIPMKLDAFYVSMLSEQYKYGKGGISKFISGILEGLLSNISASHSRQYSSLIYVIQ